MKEKVSDSQRRHELKSVENEVAEIEKQLAEALAKKKRLTEDAAASSPNQENISNNIINSLFER